MNIETSAQCLTSVLPSSSVFSESSNQVAFACWQSSDASSLFTSLVESRIGGSSSSLLFPRLSTLMLVRSTLAWELLTCSHRAQHVTDLPHMSNVLVLRFSVDQGHLLTFGVRRPDVVQDHVSESLVDTKLSCTLRSSTIAQRSSGRGTPKRHPADAVGATCIRGYEPESLGLASEGRGRRGRPEQRRPPRGQGRDGPKNIDEDITICRQVPEVPCVQNTPVPNRNGLAAHRNSVVEC